MTLYLLAITCLMVAGVHSAGWSPAWAAEWPGLLSQSLPLAGYTMLLVGSLLFARYVILDVQGLVEHRIATKTSAHSAAVAEKIESESVANQEPLSTGDGAWIDGSEPELDDDEQGTRRLSKADRKRLRKQKQRNRAA